MGRCRKQTRCVRLPATYLPQPARHAQVTGGRPRWAQRLLPRRRGGPAALLMAEQHTRRAIHVVDYNLETGTRCCRPWGRAMHACPLSGYRPAAPRGPGPSRQVWRQRGTVLSATPTDLWAAGPADVENNTSAPAGRPARSRDRDIRKRRATGRLDSVARPTWVDKRMVEAEPPPGRRHLAAVSAPLCMNGLNLRTNHPALSTVLVC